MGWRDLVDENETDSPVKAASEEGPYDRARAMARFFRRTASTIDTIAKVSAVLTLVLAAVVCFSTRNGWVLGLLMLFPAAGAWLISRPISIVYAGLGDLTDAHLDLVTRAHQPAGTES